MPNFGPSRSDADATNQDSTAFAEALMTVSTDLAAEGPLPRGQIIERVTTAYLDQVGQLSAVDTPSPRDVERTLLTMLNEALMLQNAEIRSAQEKHFPARSLTPWQVAQILIRLHHVIRVSPSNKSVDREYDITAMYVSSGPAEGTYTSSEDAIRATARRYNVGISVNEFKEIEAALREDAPRRTVCADADKIFVRNGIFDYKTKVLHPFDPSIVSMRKSHVDYVPDAPKVVITHPEDGTVWDIESWIEELSDEPGIPELLWEILGAIIRPHVRWGKAAWFYSEVGNNGKGTLCALMRNLVGHESHTSIPLSELGKEFALEPLMKVNAIIVDENDVGTYIDKAANLKAIVTNDVIQINRKYRMPVAFQFYGLMVQCLNEMPRVKDKSGSLYRRQLFVPFEKSFTGRERKYIKDDYLARRDVLEYALWYVLHVAGSTTPGSYYQLSEPEATRRVLEEYKEWNDPVRAYWNEFRERFVWDLLPFTFLYDLYKAWFASVNPSGSPVEHKRFVQDLVQILQTDDQWYCTDKSRSVRTSTHMDEPELLIHEYELKSWLNPTYKGMDPDMRSKPVLQLNYRGVRRAGVAPSTLPPIAPTTIDPEERAAA
ncbi:DNA primase [Leucobacter massiliensis]|uniref:DNA primase n=2 Tax=Leucobacter massiliensis TaxID=1686285 RepID=A0A2S9QLR4_9MICO|nr:DNA primase [Leucobacter massiliensis]